MNCCWCGHEIPENTSVCFKCGKQQVMNYMVDCGDKQVNCNRIFKPNYSDKEIMRTLRSYGLRGSKECSAFIEEYRMPYYKFMLNKEGLLHGDDVVLTDEGLMSYDYALSRYGGISQIVYNVCTAKGTHYDAAIAQVLMIYLTNLNKGDVSKKQNKVEKKSSKEKKSRKANKSRKEKKARKQKEPKAKSKGSGILSVILILILLFIVMCVTVYIIAFM